MKYYLEIGSFTVAAIVLGVLFSNGTISVMDVPKDLQSAAQKVVGGIFFLLAICGLVAIIAEIIAKKSNTTQNSGALDLTGHNYLLRKRR